MRKNINWPAQRERNRLYHRQLADRAFQRKWGRSPDDFYDRKGRPISMERWGKLSRRSAPPGFVRWNIRFKRVELTLTRDGHMISTVWLGMNHSYWDGPPRLIFETMVFCEHDDAAAKRKRNAERILAVKGPDDVAQFGEGYEETGCELDSEQDRYATAKQARKGHWRFVDRVRKFEHEKRAASIP